MEIKRTYTQAVPAFRFIGKIYHEEDRQNGNYSHKWAEAFETGLFAQIEAVAKPFYEDADAYVGLMRYREGEPFLYAIGMFVPADAPAVEGLSCIDFPASVFGVCWLYGEESTLYGQEAQVLEKLTQAGHSLWRDESGAMWNFERYGCPRFTEPDETGKMILDVGFFIQG